MEVVFPGTIKTISSGWIGSLTVTLAVLKNPQPVRVSITIRMPVAGHHVLSLVDTSVSEGPELEREPVCALPEHHIIDDSILVEQHIQVVTFDIQAGKVH